MRTAKLRTLFAALFFVISACLAQAEPFSIEPVSFTSGGTSGDASFSLSGSIGQADAGIASAASFELQGGFWAMAGFSDGTLLRIFRDGPSGVILAWPLTAGNFELQQNSTLATNNWSTVTAPPQVTNGQNQVSAPSTPGNRFFRLRSQ